MVTFFIIVGVSIYFSFKWGRKKQKNFWDSVGLAFVGLICGSIAGAIVAISVGGFWNEIDPDASIPVEEEITYLANLQDNIVSEGSFFLGIGNIKGNTRYMYYEKVGENNFHFNSMPVKDPDISYDGGLPRIVVYRWEFPEGSLAFLFGISVKSRTVIYVPKGTIKENFILDAE